MRGSIRQRSEGSWELRVFVGLDPLTGRRQYATKTVRAGKRAAQQELAAMIAGAKSTGPTASMTVGEALERWFEHAQKFAGVKNFWAEETAQWRRNNLPEPRDVSFTKIGGWDAIAYEVPAGAGTSSHIRGHWVQSETWIDLHLSITSDRPASESRTALVAFLETLDVSQK